MEAKNLVEGAAYGPEVLQVLREAFDQAWGAIATYYERSDARDIERARMKLADAILQVACATSNSVEDVKRDALERLAAQR